MRKFLLYTLILIFLYGIGCWLFWPSVSFESSDNNWADQEILLKNRDFESMAYFFSLYKLKCNAKDAILFRTTNKQIWNVFHWPSFILDKKWLVPFKEPYYRNSGIYPKVSEKHCFNDPQSDLIVSKAISNSKIYLEALK